MSLIALNRRPTWKGLATIAKMIERGDIQVGVTISTDEHAGNDMGSAAYRKVKLV